jgi:hypothetical protein
MTTHGSTLTHPSDAPAALGAPLLTHATPALALSPDGTRLIARVALPEPGGGPVTSWLWEVDPAGEGPPQRLSREPGGSPVGFTPGGDLLLTVGGALWSQAAAGASPRCLLAPAGGVIGAAVARDGTVVFASELLPRAADFADDDLLRAGTGAASATRADTARGGRTGAPQSVRPGWQRGTAPTESVPLTAHRSDGRASATRHRPPSATATCPGTGPPRPAPRLFATRLGQGTGRPEPRDLTGHVGAALDEGTWDVTPDGTTVVAHWAVPASGGGRRGTLVALDTATAGRRSLADDPRYDYVAPRISPDGRWVAAQRRRRGGGEADDRRLVLLPLAGGPERWLPAAGGGSPRTVCWTPGSRALIVAAGPEGRRQLWRVDASSGAGLRLTEDDAGYADPLPAPDGRCLYALRTVPGGLPVPVRVGTGGGEPRVGFLRGPAGVPAGRRLSPGSRGRCRR